jgi:thiamine-phosphate pyrophosphorylase
VAVLQYRDKSEDLLRRQREAELLAGLCRRHGALFIVNDDVELALHSGAAGVHLGRDDGAVAHARERLGSQAVIGVSCYDSLQRAAQLAAEGADYLAFGAVYGSVTKPQASRVTLDTLAAARRRFDHPLVAIGGIDVDNAAPVAATGVDALAVIQGVHGADDPVAAVRRLADLMKR